MSYSYDDAFKRSLNEVEKFASLQDKATKKGQLQPLLKLEKVHGQPVLKSTTGITSHIAKFLGFSGYKQSKIVDYLKSDAFTKQLETAPITHKQYNALLKVAKNLKQKTLPERIEASTKHILRPAQLPPLVESEKVSPQVVPSLNQRNQAYFAARSNDWQKLLNTVPPLPPEVLKKEVAKLYGECLEFAQEQLSAETKEGRVVFDREGKIVPGSKEHWFEAFERLATTLEAQIPDQKVLRNMLMNRCIMLQEQRKTRGASLYAGYRSIKMMMEAYCKENKIEFPSLQKFKETQSAFLEHHCNQPEQFLKDPATFMNDLHWLKGVSVFAACQVPREQTEQMFKALSALVNKDNELLEYCNTVEKEFLARPEVQGLPEMAQKALAAEVWGKAYESGREELQKFIQENVKEIPKGITWSENLAKLSFSELKRDTARADAGLAFYTKWQGNLVKEMMQGFIDPGEDLGGGACMGVTLRWIAEALLHEPLSTPEMAIEKMKFGQILAEDRVRQAKHQMITRGEKSAKDHLRLGTDLGIVEKAWLTEDKPQGKEQIKATIKAWVQDSRFQTEFKGVGRLSIGLEEKSGHTLMISCQKNPDKPSEMIFRIADANNGLFSFTAPVDDQKAQEPFFDALTDLISTYTQTPTWLHLFGYTAASKAPKSTPEQS